MTAALSSLSSDTTDTYVEIHSSAANGGSPMRGVRLECPAGSGNPTKFRVTHLDGYTQEVVLAAGASVTIEDWDPRSGDGRITKVEVKQATAEAASKYAHITTRR